MELVNVFGKEDLAQVYVLRLRGREDRLVECVESVQPPRPRSDKWVLIVSTLFGCPVDCAICDAGGDYRGRLTADEILGQIHFMTERRYGSRSVPSRRFKIQFARMGDPAFNPAVLEALRRLPGEVEAPGLQPSVSTVAPRSAEAFFEELLEIKDRFYGDGLFQLQFSLHTTDPETRRRLVPTNTFDFAWMGRYGERFLRAGDQRITLNFAALEGTPIEPDRLTGHFDPERFLIKLTPVNPTAKVIRSGMKSWIDPARPVTAQGLIERFEKAGYRVILSIGETEENLIGSNCGQYASEIREGCVRVRNGYVSERYSQGGDKL